jgi:hypothetical protein
MPGDNELAFNMPDIRTAITYSVDKPKMILNLGGYLVKIISSIKVLRV